MGICYICGKEIVLPFRCSYCNLTFCAEHRLPENHQCSRLPKREWIPKGEKTLTDARTHTPSSNRVNNISSSYTRKKYPKRRFSSKQRKVIKWLFIASILIVSLYIIADNVIPSQNLFDPNNPNPSEIERISNRIKFMIQYVIIEVNSIITSKHRIQIRTDHYWVLTLKIREPGEDEKTVVKKGFQNAEFIVNGKILYAKLDYDYFRSRIGTYLQLFIYKGEKSIFAVFSNGPIEYDSALERTK